MHNTISPLKKVVDHPYFGLVCLLTLFLVLPRYGAAPMMIGSAVVLSVCIGANPDRYRGRSGSLTAAVSLLTAVWVGVVIFSVMLWLGSIE